LSSALVEGNMATGAALKDHGRVPKRPEGEIDQAMKNYEARAAMLIGESIRNVLDTIDAQPAEVIEAVTEQAKQVHQSGCAPEHRYGLQVAMIEYFEQRLHEARAREHPLAQVVTGVDLPTATTAPEAKRPPAP
jgi:hypothetical protein